MVREIERELGLDEILAIESSVVSIRVEQRRYGKNVTVLSGFDRGLDVQGLGKELKHHLGTGGTVKDGAIELQGEHRAKARSFLEGRGFTVE